LTLVLTFFLGPKVKFEKVNPVLDSFDLGLEQLDAYLKKDSQTKNLKPNNEAQIIWAKQDSSKTKYAIVYLHGFSASGMEGNPIHLEYAKKKGYNLYLPRLSQHGIHDKESFRKLTPSELMDSAKEALAVGKLLGEKIILMSCSTGSTLAVSIVANNPGLVDAQIMFSPNFGLADERAEMIMGPWGKQIAEKINGSEYRTIGVPKSCLGFWTNEYHINGIFVVQSLIEQCIKEEYFKNIDHPVFIGYYFKNDQEKDPILSIEAIEKYANLIPSKNKKVVAFKNSKSHVMIAECQSKDLEEVRVALGEFEF